MNSSVGRQGRVVIAPLQSPSITSQTHSVSGRHFDCQINVVGFSTNPDICFRSYSGDSRSVCRSRSLNSDTPIVPIHQGGTQEVRGHVDLKACTGCFTGKRGSRERLGSTALNRGQLPGRPSSLVLQADDKAEISVSRLREMRTGYACAAARAARAITSSLALYNPSLTFRETAHQRVRSLR